MKEVNTLEYNGYATKVMLTPEVEAFLTEKRVNLDLSQHIPGLHYWYEGFIFLNTPRKEHRNYDLIYCGIVNGPRDNESRQRIADRLGLKFENIVADGAVQVHEAKPSFLVRWVVSMA